MAYSMEFLCVRARTHARARVCGKVDPLGSTDHPSGMMHIAVSSFDLVWHVFRVPLRANVNESLVCPAQLRIELPC